MAAQQETQLKHAGDGVLALLQEEASVFVDYSCWGVANSQHCVYIQLDLSADALHVLCVQISSIAKAFDGALESQEIDFIKAQTALRLVYIVFLLRSTFKLDCLVSGTTRTPKIDMRSEVCLHF